MPSAATPLRRRTPSERCGDNGAPPRRPTLIAQRRVGVLAYRSRPPYVPANSAGLRGGRVTRPFRHFEIRGLHGDRNIRLDFRDRSTILLGENGSGKTTVLTALYALLTGKFHKLLSFEFDELVLAPRVGKHIHFTRAMAQQCIPDFDSPHAARLLRHMSTEQLSTLVDLTRDSSEDVRYHPEFRSATKRIPEPPAQIQQRLEVLVALGHGIEEPKEVAAVREAIERELSSTVLYFPTYRRVEEELHQLGYARDHVAADEQLIHFGMGDVQRRFDRATSSLRQSAAEWYARTSGRMLSQLIGGITVGDNEFAQLRKADALGIVLERVGDGITKDERQKILQLVKSDEIRAEKYRALVYFLSNLVEIYDRQREEDARIKAFAEVVNRYLVDKAVVYDERQVAIRIVDTISGRQVELGRLSSGEKQTVSLFSRLYLGDATQYAILFDEPELSLSMEWQQTLLPDILASNRCHFLLAATHSPFIFENDLDEDACELTIERLPPAVVHE